MPLTEMNCPLCGTPIYQTDLGRYEKIQPAAALNTDNYQVHTDYRCDMAQIKNFKLAKV